MISNKLLLEPTEELIFIQIAEWIVRFLDRQRINTKESIAQFLDMKKNLHYIPTILTDPMITFGNKTLLIFRKSNWLHSSQNRHKFLQKFWVNSCFLKFHTRIIFTKESLLRYKTLLTKNNVKGIVAKFFYLIRNTNIATYN